jgi:hypothetical protein
VARRELIAAPDRLTADLEDIYAKLHPDRLRALSRRRS